MYACVMLRAERTRDKIGRQFVAYFGRFVVHRLVGLEVFAHPFQAAPEVLSTPARRDAMG